MDPPTSAREDKTHSCWISSCIVQERTGNSSYVVQYASNNEKAVHISQMKPYVEDTFAGSKIGDFYFRQTTADQELETKINLDLHQSPQDHRSKQHH